MSTLQHSIRCMLSLGLMVGATPWVLKPALAANATINVAARDFAGLIAAINTANNEKSNPGPDTIVLAPGTYLYDAATMKPHNWEYGPNALPPITSDITIEGNGAVLDSSEPVRLRFFYVSGGLSYDSATNEGLPTGKLTLRDLTLQNGKQKGGDSHVGGGGLGAGGAIFNQGELMLERVTLTQNRVYPGYSLGLPSPDTATVLLMRGGGGMGEDARGDSGGGFGGKPLGKGGKGFMAGGGFRPADSSPTLIALKIFGNTGGPGAGGGLGNLGGWSGTHKTMDGGASDARPWYFSSGVVVGGDYGYGGITGDYIDAPGNVIGGGGGIGSGGGVDGGYGGFGGGGGGGLYNGYAGGFGGGGGVSMANTFRALPGFGGGPNGGGAAMGGAIFNHRGSLNLINTTLVNNRADVQRPDGNLSDGQALGGAIFNLNGNVNIINCTFHLNQVLSDRRTGHAVYNLAYGSKIEDGSLSIAKTTIRNSILQHFIKPLIIDGVIDSVPVLTNDTAPGTTTDGTVIGTTIHDNTAEVDYGDHNIITHAVALHGTSFTGTLFSTSDSNLSKILANNGGLTPTVLPAAGSPAIDNGTSTGAPTRDQRGIQRPQGSALDIGATEIVDSTAPTITPFITGIPGINDWYVSDVNVTWKVEENESRISSDSGCTTTLITNDTPGTTFTCSATSTGGTNSKSVTIKRDSTPPSLTPSITPTALLLNGTATTNLNAVDALSGLATTSCETALTNRTGSFTMACKATDNAGNTSFARAPYTVAYNISNFPPAANNLSLVNLAVYTGKAGSTFPLIWQIKDANGVVINNLDAVPAINYQANDCRLLAPKPTGPLTAAGSSDVAGLSYDPTTQEFVFNWSTPNTAGCYTLFLSLLGGQVNSAFFSLD